MLSNSWYKMQRSKLEVEDKCVSSDLRNIDSRENICDGKVLWSYCVLQEWLMEKRGLLHNTRGLQPKIGQVVSDCYVNSSQHLLTKSCLCQCSHHLQTSPFPSFLNHSQFQLSCVGSHHHLPLLLTCYLLRPMLSSISYPLSFITS